MHWFCLEARGQLGRGGGKGGTNNAYTCKYENDKIKGEEN
jgi:hypothetical protein